MIDRNIAPMWRSPGRAAKLRWSRPCFLTSHTWRYDPDIRRFAGDDPRGFLALYAVGAIFDGIQRAPELSSYLQGMVDANPKPGQFILTGSQQFQLMTQVTQSLTVRTGFAPAAVDIG